MTPWWTEQAAGMIGGMGGAIGGALGGIIGSAMGVCAPRGWGRVPLIGAQGALASAGLLALLAGVFAALTEQPYHVYYPLVLGGSIFFCVLTALLPVTLTIYRIGAARRADQAQRVPAAIAADPAQNLSPGIARELIDTWGPGGRYRALSLILLFPMAAAGVAGLIVGGVAVAEGRSSLAWWMLAQMMLVGAFILGLMALVMNAQVNRLRSLVESQRLAAAELRRA